MSTALELVNRVRVKRRASTSTVITDKEGVAFLDAVNTAITTVLEERTWSFQQRSDGVLVTAPKATFSGSVFSQSSTAITLQTLSVNGSAYNDGSAQARVVVTSDADYGNTSYALENIQTGTSALTGTLREAWRGTTNVLTSAGIIYAYEYLLPSTVRDVLNVWHQESDVALFFEDAQYTFDRLVPRPHDNFSDEPQFVMVGGEVQATAEYVDGVDDVGEFGMALRVYPVPESVLTFNYAYLYKQPVLTVATSELLRVPQAVEDLIVELATARVISGVEKDIQTGLPLEAKVMKRIDQVHRNHAPAYGKPKALLSLDHVGRAASPHWPPNSVAGLSGS